MGRNGCAGPFLQDVQGVDLAAGVLPLLLLLHAQGVRHHKGHVTAAGLLDAASGWQFPTHDYLIYQSMPATRNNHDRTVNNSNTSKPFMNKKNCGRMLFFKMAKQMPLAEQKHATA